MYITEIDDVSHGRPAHRMDMVAKSFELLQVKIGRFAPESSY